MFGSDQAGIPLSRLNVCCQKENDGEGAQEATVLPAYVRADKNNLKEILFQQQVKICKNYSLL